MDVKETLLSFKKEIDFEIEAYLNKVIKESSKQDRFITDAIRNVKKIILAGGKRLRAAFMYYGYIAAGGKEREKILKTAVSIELIHIFLLIHDDIIDRDSIRHGVKTINETYAELGKRIFPKSDYKHFGNSMGIVIGDIIAGFGNQILFNSNFRDDLVMRALHRLQSITSYTAIGEAQDVYMEFKGKASEKEIMKMYENKTAKYTIEGPLYLGAILAGAEGKLLEGLSKYAIPVGIAFQIQDDILGVFGSEKKMGKAVGADVREGKQTILTAKVRQKYNRNQKNIFEKALGNPNLNKKDLEQFQKIIVETGTLDHAQKKSSELVNQGKAELEKIDINKEAEEFLMGIADYLVSREV